MAAYPAMHSAGGNDAAIAVHEAVIMSWTAVDACLEFDYKFGHAMTIALGDFFKLLHHDEQWA